MKVLIVNGVAAAGKNTFALILKQMGYTVYSYSSIDWIKEKALLMGWDGVKDKKGRQLLYDLKQAAIKYNNIPLNKVAEKMKIFSDSDYLCVDIREPSEIRKLKILCKGKGIDCYTVNIINPEAEQRMKLADIDNPADTQTDLIPYDINIYNDDIYEVFRERVIKIDALLKLGDIKLQDTALFDLDRQELKSDIMQYHSNADEYQSLIADHYADLPVPELDSDSIMFLINALALCGEAGEIANIVKKIVWYRKGDITPEDQDILEDEIGDNLYHAAQLATIVKRKLSAVMLRSAAKCISRGTDGFEEKGKHG